MCGYMGVIFRGLEGGSEQFGLQNLENIKAQTHIDSSSRPHLTQPHKAYTHVCGDFQMFFGQRQVDIFRLLTNGEQKAKICEAEGPYGQCSGAKRNGQGEEMWDDG